MITSIDSFDRTRILRESFEAFISRFQQLHVLHPKQGRVDTEYRSDITQ